MFDVLPDATDLTYLDLVVGPYSLALVAQAVLAVVPDAPVGRDIERLGQKVPTLDLAAAWLGSERARVPYLVVFEGDGRSAAVGVDRVGHLTRGTTPIVARVPPLGLARPQLVEGALRDGERLLIVLRPAALAALTHQRLQAI